MLPRAAPFWRRIAALIYDLLVLMAIWMVTAALILLAFQGEVDVARQPPLYHVLLQAALFVVTALYFVVSWRKGGQTIGMRAWRIAVRADHGTLSLKSALLRALVGLFLPGLLWCLFDPRRRALHDRVADSAVVHLPKR